MLIGVTMLRLLSMVAPPMPYGYLWEMLFVAILAVGLVLAIKYLSFGKRWGIPPICSRSCGDGILD
jgi:hypothetical protein